MHIEIINKDSFCVIGKKGSTDMGTGFIQKLWNEANTHFNEISNLVKRDDEEKPLACWGAMSDFSMSFMPWENNFTRVNTLQVLNVWMRLWLLKDGLNGQYLGLNI